MDTGRGYLEALSKDDALLADKHGVPVFEVGEVVELKGSRFRIHTIQKEGMVLKVLESKTVRGMVDLFKREAKV